MPAITLGGLSSGLPSNLVEQIIEAERQPIKNLEGRKANEDSKLKLVNDLDTKLRAIESSLGTLASVKGFNDIKLESGDTNVLQGSADTSAPKGSWNVEVMQLAQKASVVTNGFPDRDKSQIGTGYIRFQTAEGEREVFINSNNNTLDGVAAAINDSNLGIKAAVINDRKDPDYPFRLMISGDGVGGDSRVEFPTLYFLDGDQDIYFDHETEATNGVVKIDGFEFEVSSNTVSDLIPGVTLDLKQASPGRQVNVTIKENREVVSTKVGEFVKSMNEVLGFLQSQSRIDQGTDTTKTLGGEQIVRQVESRLRRLIQDPQYGVGGSIKRLNQLGIEITRDGVLKLNEEKFNQVLASTPDDVKMFFAGDGFNHGFVPAVRKEIATVTNAAFGSVAMRRRSLQDNIGRINQNIENKERQLVRREEQLRRKFAQLEETMSRLKGQGQALQAAQYQGPNLGGATLQKG